MSWSLAARKLMGFRIDSQDRPGGDRVLLFKDRVTVIVNDDVAVAVHLLDPVL